MLGALLIPALPFVVPSSEASLARIWGLGARRAGQFTVVVSIVRQSQSSADDGADRHGQTSVLVGYRILDLAPCAALIGVSHACTPKLERRTRCRYSPRNRRATGPCCQSKPGHVGQKISESVCDHWHCVEDDDRPLVMMVAQFRDEDWQA